VLDRKFDADALAGLREAVLGYATACGMPEDRAIDVVLAVHELAANAVRHGPGRGRLRIHVTASTLHCEVSNPGQSSRDGRVPGDVGGPAAGTPGAVPWPVEQGHGLWLVHATADHLRVTSGPHGTLITAVFALPATAAAPPRPAGRASPATAPAADPRHRTVPIAHPEHPATGLNYKEPGPQRLNTSAIKDHRALRAHNASSARLQRTGSKGLIPYRIR